MDPIILKILKIHEIINTLNNMEIKSLNVHISTSFLSLSKDLSTIYKQFKLDNYESLSNIIDFSIYDKILKDILMDEEIISNYLSDIGKMNCDEWRDYFYEKYLKSDINKCSGLKDLPSTWTELRENLAYGDDFNAQITCVLLGYKPLTVAWYDQYEVEYTMKGYGQVKDKQLDEVCLHCGVKRLMSESGTEYWYEPYYEKNAKLLMMISDHIGKQIDVEGINTVEVMECIRSLLLGYSYNSIIVYNIFTNIIGFDDNMFKLAGKKNPTPSEEKMLTDKYLQRLPKYINKYNPIIREAKKWIRDRGGHIVKY